MAATLDDLEWRRLTTRHPGLSLARAVFQAFLEDRESDTHLDDLYLACAASHGDQVAIAVLEAEHFPALRMIIGRAHPKARDLDDLLQGVRERLFSASPGGRPKIAEYTGRSSLAAWLRVVTNRHVVSVRRKRTEEPTDEGVELLPSGDAGADPELAYLRNTFRDVFQAAFRAAACTLDSEARNVLRYHYIDGLSIDEIGAIYKLHRVSASRRVRRARDLLVERTRSELRKAHFETSSELESILRAVESEVELSIKAILDPAQPESLQR